MMKFLMRKMMPAMSGTIEKMDFPEKETMMDQMMPHMLANLTFEERMALMQKMMPSMMQDIEPSQMEAMMDTMMPLMMNMMEQKGIDVFRMMEMMCPKCVSVATSGASEDERSRLKAQMLRVFADLQ
jgi:hypothetical protein